MKMEIELNSPTLSGTGQSSSTHIDNQGTYDKFGFPYIAGRRLKGTLRDSASQVSHMLVLKVPTIQDEIDQLFGTSGRIKGDNNDDQLLTISNAYLLGYENLFNWIKFLTVKKKIDISRDEIIDNYSVIYESTAIENGITKENSLRSLRYFKPRLTFEVDIIPRSELNETQHILLGLAAKNLRFLGASTTRGKGNVSVTIYDNAINLNDFAVQKIKEIWEEEQY